MQFQLALRLRLHLRRFLRSLLLSRRRTRKKQEQKILWQSEHCCSSHVRTKTAIELAGTYQDAKVRSDWMVSGFSRDIIRRQRLDNLAKLIAQNRNKSC